MKIHEYFTLFLNKIKISALSSAKVITKCAFFFYCLVLQRKGNVYELQTKVISWRTLCLQTGVMFVSAAHQRHHLKHAVWACSAAYHESRHWFWDHNNSHGSHSVMEISHLIESFLCGSYTVDESYTQFEPFDVLWILQMDSELISRKVSIPLCRRKRTVNHP